MLSIKVDIKEVVNRLGVMQAKLPEVLKNSVNQTAFELRNKYIESLKSSFPSLKPQTAKNVFVRQADTKTKSYDRRGNYSASIVFDQIWKGPGIDEYMVAQVQGGKRAMKPSEKRLGHYYVPGMGAKLDAYGNMSGGQVTQILSQMGRFGNVGSSMNQTAKSRKLAKQGSKTTEYFMIQRQRGGLKPGVYQRTEKRNGFTSVGKPKAMRGQQGHKALQQGRSRAIQGRGAIPVLVFTKAAPTYTVRWPFFNQGQAFINKRLPEVMSKYIDYAIKGRL